MQYEPTVELLIESPFDEDRVMRQVESLFAVGTVMESFADALKLDVDPHFLSVAVSATSPRTTTVRSQSGLYLLMGKSRSAAV